MKLRFSPDQYPCSITEKKEEIPLYTGVPSKLQAMIVAKRTIEIDFKEAELMLSTMYYDLYRCNYCGRMSNNVKACPGCGASSYATLPILRKEGRAPSGIVILQDYPDLGKGY